MKVFSSFFFVVVFQFSFSQVNLKGVWQGIMLKDGLPNEKASILFADFTLTGNVLSGKMRDEIYNSELYAVKRVKGTVAKNSVTFSQYVIEKKTLSSSINWCLIDATLSYNDSTGYLEGRYSSSNCKRNTGKIILFQSNAVFSATATSPLTHSWFSRFLLDLKKEYNAPRIREAERKAFLFQAVWFDYDKAEIRPEHTDFLLKIVRVVDGHSDLRIKVTGHTDADGSDTYNLDLSKRRAQALIDFFVANGLREDRIVIDFKGEALPVGSNTTEEGKQLNRRVDFSFI